MLNLTAFFSRHYFHSSPTLCSVRGDEKQRLVRPACVRVFVTLPGASIETAGNYLQFSQGSLDSRELEKRSTSAARSGPHGTVVLWSSGLVLGSAAVRSDVQIIPRSWEYLRRHQRQSQDVINGRHRRHQRHSEDVISIPVSEQDHISWRHQRSSVDIRKHQQWDLQHRDLPVFLTSVVVRNR